MRVAVFRARDDGERTAARLRALGHEPLVAPVFEVVRTGVELPAGPFDAVIFTSAHGVQTLRGDELAELAHLPCFCVGDRTADCAEQSGFADVRSGRADAARLADTVRAAMAPSAHLLFVTARDRKQTLEGGLLAAGYRLSVAEAYEARSLNRWSEPAETAFAREAVMAALHFSRRSALLALHCAQAGPALHGFLRARHHCVSADAAEPLRAAGVANPIIAAEPTEEALLRTLGAEVMPR